MPEISTPQSDRCAVNVQSQRDQTHHTSKGQPKPGSTTGNGGLKVSIGKRIGGENITMITRFIFGLSFLVLCSGCSTTGHHVQWYQGPPLSTNEISLLKIQRDMWGSNALVNKINGEPLAREKKRAGNTTREIDLLPGKYDLAVGYFSPDGGGGSHSLADIPISFNAEAGKIYQLRAAPEEVSLGRVIQLTTAGGTFGWTAWILDARTGKVLAGKPREIPIHWYER